MGYDPESGIGLMPDGEERVFDCEADYEDAYVDEMCEDCGLQELPEDWVA